MLNKGKNQPSINVPTSTGTKRGTRATNQYAIKRNKEYKAYQGKAHTIYQPLFSCLYIGQEFQPAFLFDFCKHFAEACSIYFAGIFLYFLHQHLGMFCCGDR